MNRFFGVFGSGLDKDGGSDMSRVTSGELAVDPKPASRPVALAGDGIAGDGTLGDGMVEDDAEACAPANLTCCCRVLLEALVPLGRR